MRAGAMDRRIAILAIGETVDDGMRAKPGEWVETAKRWAELTPLSGAERVVAAENAAVETLKFRVRRDSLTVTLDPALNRIGYGGRTYDLTDRQEVGRHAFDLLVSGRADAGAEGRL